MVWTRLDPFSILPFLRVSHVPGEAGGNAGVALVASHLREALLRGQYVAVQDERGRLFIGTEAEAAEFMMQNSQLS